MVGFFFLGGGGSEPQHNMERSELQKNLEGCAAS